MANKNKPSRRGDSKAIANIANTISNTMNSLYRSTYMTTPQNKNSVDNLGYQINKSIDNIVGRNMDIVGVPSVSKLYSRLIDANDETKNLMEDLQTMFDSGTVTDDLYSVFMSNRYLKELDNEIDTVCKYMPDLEESLAVQKDCVLSADHFSKDFLNITMNGIDNSDLDVFNDRIKEIKRKYNLPAFIEEVYDDTSKYGEVFIYRVPYALAIGRLLGNKQNLDLRAPSSLKESYNNQQNETFNLKLVKDKFSIFSTGDGSIVYTESMTSSSKSKDDMTLTPSILKDKEEFNISVEICTSNIIESIVLNSQNSLIKKDKISESSAYTQFINEANAKNIQASGNIDIGMNRADNVIGSDGLISDNGGQKIVKVKAPGCVISKLARDRVIPGYIDDLCMGYYYLELKTLDDSESFMGFKNILGDPLTNMRGDHRTTFNSVDTQRQDQTLKYISGQLSKLIDKKFVNSNQDLSREIYMILKHNDLFNTPTLDKIKVTFIPPEDMVHSYFRMDRVTHRGISDLDRSLIPAKIYSSLYITTAIGTLTRSQDKRVYYVKQTVDTNIAQTLLTTIAQIKQGNFGIRQFQNINNILNITGRFNDYVIPTSASGEPPIQFEVMPGQDINTPTELMEQLKEMAINATNIPIEIIQARKSVDYAMQLTMSSSKVLRFCYKRQSLYQKICRDLITPIYNYEYNESDTLDVTLPPPTFINITNTNQLVDNTKNFVASIVDVELNSEPDDRLKAMYTNKLFKHYMGTHLDISTHEQILDKCRLELKKEENESHDNSGEAY